MSTGCHEKPLASCSARSSKCGSIPFRLHMRLLVSTECSCLSAIQTVNRHVDVPRYRCVQLALMPHYLASPQLLSYLSHWPMRVVVTEAEEKTTVKGEVVVLVQCVTTPSTYSSVFPRL
jgi:hypothetical protein